MREPIRNHISSVIMNVFKTIKEFIFLYIIIIVRPNPGTLLVLIVLFILTIVFSFIKWYKTYFYIKEDTLIYETGLFQKKVLSLSMDKIATIDFSQNLIQKIFNTYRLKIDSGSTQAKESEIDIVLKKSIAINTKDILLKSSQEDNLNTTNATVFKASFKELFLTAITKNNLALGIGIFFSLSAFLDDILKLFNIEFKDTLYSYIKLEQVIKQSIPSLIVSMVKVFLIVWMLCIVLSIIGTIIKFYDFKVYKAKEHIRIEYGLISTKSYSLPVNNVHALILKQNLFKQKLGLYNVEVSSIGYGNEEKEEAILYPIANKKLLNTLISELLPELQIQWEVSSAPKNTLSNFIIVPLIISITALSIITLIFNKAAILFLLLPLIIISSYLNYRNSAIGFNNKILTSISGGFNKRICTVKISSIQSLSIKSNYFQRKKKVGTYIIDYYANKLVDIIEVKNIKASLFEEIGSKFDY